MHRHGWRRRRHHGFGHAFGTLWRRSAQPLLRPGRAAPRAALAARGRPAARLRADAPARVALGRALPRERGIRLPDAPAARGRGPGALRGRGRQARLPAQRARASARCATRRTRSAASGDAPSAGTSGAGSQAPTSGSWRGRCADSRRRCCARCRARRASPSGSTRCARSSSARGATSSDSTVASARPRTAETGAGAGAYGLGPPLSSSRATCRPARGRRSSSASRRGRPRSRCARRWRRCSPRQRAELARRQAEVAQRDADLARGLGVHLHHAGVVLRAPEHERAPRQRLAIAGGEVLVDPLRVGLRREAPGLLEERRRRTRRGCAPSRAPAGRGPPRGTSSRRARARRGSGAARAGDACARLPCACAGNAPNRRSTRPSPSPCRPGSADPGRS